MPARAPESPRTVDCGRGSARSRRGCACGQRGNAAARASFTQRRQRPSGVLLRWRFRRDRLPRRRGRARRVDHPLPPRQARALRRRRADPRLDPPRDHLDGRAGPDPHGDRVLRLPQAAEHRGCAQGKRRRLDDDHGRRASVLLAVPLPERRDLGRHDDRTGRQRRERGRPRPRHGRPPQLVGPGARRQDRRDPGPDEPHLVQGRRRGVSRRAAPTSAGSSTP